MIGNLCIENVLSEINEGTNLAEMDWQEFEYLARESFEYDSLANGVRKVQI